MPRFLRQGAAAFAWRTALGAMLAATVALASPEVRASAAGEPAGAAADPEGQWERAPVLVDGATLFSVRGIPARPAPERAEAIAERITAVAGDPSISPDAIRLQETDLGTAIMAGDRRLMIVADVDAQGEGASRAVVAEAYRQPIVAAVREYRAARTPERLARAATYAGIGVAVLALALFAIARLVRRVDALVARRLGSRIRDVGIQSVRLVSARAIWAVIRAIVRTIALVAALAATYLCAWYALDRFPGTHGAANRLASWSIEPLEALGSALVGALPGLLFLIVLALATRYLLRLLRVLFEQVERGAVRFAHFEPEWAMPTYRIARLLVIAFAAIVAYPYIPGSESAAFKGVSLFLGVMFSLGSTSIVANVIAGYSMTYRRAFRVGDVIKAGDAFGRVTDVRLQVTHLRNPQNEEVIVPNSQLLQSTVVNYSSLSRESGLVLHTEVGIGYETPWRQVEAMLLLAADRAEGFLKEPKPFVRQRSLGDFAVVYELNVYTLRVTEMLALYTELHRHILDVFNEYGVQIMTPNYVADTAAAKVVPKDQWFLAPGTSVRPIVAPAELEREK